MNKLKTLLTITALTFTLFANSLILIVNAETEDDHTHFIIETEVHRLYNPNSGEHFYTKNTDERDYLDSIGWNYEGVAFKAVETRTASGYKNINRLYNPNSGEHYYTKDLEEMIGLSQLGWRIEGVAWGQTDECSVEIYKLYNPNATGVYEVGAHHYTANASERDYLVSLGWNYEGIGWYAL